MHSKDKIFGAFLLLFIYLLSINILAVKPVPLKYSFENESGRKYIAASSQKFFEHTLNQTENLSGFFVSENQDYNFFSWQTISTQDFERLFQQFFSDYSAIFLSLCINWKNTLLLYPFHFFF